MADPMRIRATMSGDAVVVRVLMSHEMETGQRKDGSGNVVPAHFIQTVVAKVHVEPFAAYSTKYKSVAEIPDGATVAIPNDPSNSGRALLVNTLQLRRLLDGSIRLSWSSPYVDVETGPPDVYRVRRRTGNEAPFENLAETEDLFYVDSGALALPAAQYEVTPVWK